MADAAFFPFDDDALDGPDFLLELETLEEAFFGAEELAAPLTPFFAPDIEAAVVDAEPATPLEDEAGVEFAHLRLLTGGRILAKVSEAWGLLRGIFS